MISDGKTQLQEICDRLNASAAKSDSAVVSLGALEILWLVAEQRPDYEDLPLWIAERETEIRKYAEKHEFRRVAESIASISQAGAKAYGSKADAMSVSKAGLEAVRCAEKFNSLNLVSAYRSIGLALLAISNGQKRLPVTIEGNHIRIGRHTTVSFKRTLRIPEDDKDYPLPADYGALPIHPVAEYAAKVPKKWLEDGGFFIPLYQKEALFLEFGGVKWRPSIIKVAVGGINAITGAAYDERVRTHKQDYVVVPDQHWLDGINSGEGTVGQFVAMPLGQGYTVEEQITDEAKFGGFQIVAFEAKDERFPSEDPEITKKRQEAHKDFKRRHVESTIVLSAPVPKRDGDEWSEEDGGGILYSAAQDDYDSSSASAPVEMGIAKGGSIKQQIIEDSYGSDSWDEAQRGAVYIHIVNSEMYERITGLKPPASPITPEEYKKGRLPWFNDYDEHASFLKPAKLFQRVKGILGIEKRRRIQDQSVVKEIEISPELIRRIRVPSLEEKTAELRKRAEASWKAGRYRIAHRESSCLLDLSRLDTWALQIRADSNNKLTRYSDAAQDATECLEISPNNIFALSARAVANLQLGDAQLARVDARAILSSEPKNARGLRLCAEAEYRLEKFVDAITSISQLLVVRPNDAAGFLFRARCQLERKNPSEAVSDAGRALSHGGPDAEALSVRALGRLQLGDLLLARSDAVEALRIQPEHALAQHVLAKSFDQPQQ